MAKGPPPVIFKDPDTGAVEEHSIPATKHLVVGKGDYVKKGQKITVGSIVPQMLLSICGPQELQRYLVNEIQTVYRAQGVEINDKHIEVIIRQMMQKVRITEQGSTPFLSGEQIDKHEFMRVNEQVRDSGGQPAEAEPVLLGITKASLETDSFVSAALLPGHHRILTDAATLGKIDMLRGFKENVITGISSPAGTGAERFLSLRMKKTREEIR
jgi:DNA-directed RNA polymerase subunit beta'